MLARALPRISLAAGVTRSQASAPAAEKSQVQCTLHSALNAVRDDRCTQKREETRGEASITLIDLYGHNSKLNEGKVGSVT